MKKLMIVFAAGVLLASCSNSQDKEAAAEFCTCFNMGAGESTDFMELMEAQEKMQKCVTSWQAKFKEKVTKDGFSTELKKACPDAHAQAEEMGMFKE